VGTTQDSLKGVPVGLQQTSPTGGSGRSRESLTEESLNQVHQELVIAPEVEDPDVVQAQLRHITIRLGPTATAKDLIWELSQLFPGRTARVQ
jgi:hypothetical protein